MDKVMAKRYLEELIKEMDNEEKTFTESEVLSRLFYMFDDCFDGLPTCSQDEGCPFGKSGDYNNTDPDCLGCGANSYVEKYKHYWGIN